MFYLYISDSPFMCHAQGLGSVSVRSLEMQLAVDKTSSFYVNSEQINDDLNVNVDISCKFYISHVKYMYGFRG